MQLTTNLGTYFEASGNVLKTYSQVFVVSPYKTIGKLVDIDCKYDCFIIKDSKAAFAIKKEFDDWIQLARLFGDMEALKHTLQ